jgi:small subunit ribosomal protein S20
MRDAHLCGFFVSRVNLAFQHSFLQRVVLHARTISCFRKGMNMANIKSQKKRNITNEKAHQRNKACKSELKTAVRRVREAVAAGNGAEAYAAALAASRLLDKAASKGIIHKNQAANRKSGVMQLANTIVTDADRAAYVKPEPKKQEATGNKKAAKKAERKAALAAASAEKAKRREKQLKEEAAAKARKAKEAEEAAKAEAAEAEEAAE